MEGHLGVLGRTQLRMRNGHRPTSYEIGFQPQSSGGREVSDNKKILANRGGMVVMNAMTYCHLGDRNKMAPWTLAALSPMM